MIDHNLEALKSAIAALRGAGEDYLVLSVGVRGSNIEMPEGNAVATVRMGDDEATCEAKYLTDAIALARAKIIRDRQAKAERRAKEKAKELSQ